VIIVRRPVDEQAWFGVAIQPGVDLPTNFSGLKTGAAATDIPMLGQRKDLIRTYLWIPDIYETCTAEILDILKRVRPSMRGRHLRRGAAGSPRGPNAAAGTRPFLHVTAQSAEPGKFFQRHPAYRNCPVRRQHLVTEHIPQIGVQLYQSTRGPYQCRGRRVSRGGWQIWRCRERATLTTARTLLFDRNAVEYGSISVNETVQSCHSVIIVRQMCSYFIERASISYLAGGNIQEVFRLRSM
jgi:hypothetical protein